MSLSNCNILVAITEMDPIITLQHGIPAVLRVQIARTEGVLKHNILTYLMKSEERIFCPSDTLNCFH